jgi:hypothetical protein
LYGNGDAVGCVFARIGSDLNFCAGDAARICTLAFKVMQEIGESLAIVHALEDIQFSRLM